jgi:Zn finger protein HypA/HybF involved in hydrogenase expression
MATIKCLNCAELLVSHEPFHSESAKGRPRRQCPLEQEEDQAFFRCPSCKAKNVVVETRSTEGFPELTVVACILK